MKKVCMSRATRLRLCALDLVEGVRNALYKAILDEPVRAGDDLREFAERQLKLLSEAALQCFQATFGTPTYTVEPKALRAYKHSMVKVKNLILRVYPGKETPSIEFCNAVLAVLEQVRDQLPGDDDGPHQAWGKLVEELQVIYLRCDPDMDAVEDMRRGEQVAAQIVGCL